MRELLKYFKGDPVIWVIVFLLFGLSLVSVYSFVDILARTEGGSPFKYLAKHFVHICIGAIAMFLIHKQDPKYFAKLSKAIYYGAIALLIFTFLFGVRINDASRWINIPFVGTFQTSDLARVALVIYLAKQLVNKKDVFDNWKKGFWPVVLPILGICGLIAKDNFSTAAIIFLISLGILFIGRFPLKKIGALILGGLGAFALVILTHIAVPALNILPRFDTWMSRFFKAYGDTAPNLVENAQAINAELAIHSGGFFGVGVGDGKLKEYTSQAYADFYFSSFVEEFGIFLSIVLILLYLILLYRIIRIGLKSEKLFETYVCIGIGMLLLSQASINMLVCTGVFPVTGQNIPFLSMGGSAMIMACVSIGIIQSIAAKQSGALEEVKTKSKTSKNALEI